MVDSNYGMLLNQNITLHRQYFKEMCKLIGIRCVYRAPKQSKTWTRYGEIDSNYEQPIIVDCVFDSNPDVKTMKKLGWTAEVDNQPCIITVPYDLPGIQVGALFIIPDPLNPTKGKLFRVTQMSLIAIYPASITCELVPEYEDAFEKELEEHSTDSLNLLTEEGDYL